MSQFTKEYQQFFTSPAGISLLTWLQEQRTNEHEATETDIINAAYHGASARAYRDITDHIEGVMIPLKSSPYSSRAAMEADALLG